MEELQIDKEAKFSPQCSQNYQAGDFSDATPTKIQSYIVKKISKPGKSPLKKNVRNLNIKLQ